MRDTPRVSEKSGDARAIRVGIIGRHLCVLFLSDRQLLHVVEVPTEAFEKLVAGGARANGKVEIAPRAAAGGVYACPVLYLPRAKKINL